MQSTIVNNKIHNTQLQHYLQTIDWNNKVFTENELRTILGAACMRYLVGLTDIAFVLELSEAIRTKEYNNLTPEFQRTTDMLHNIAGTMQENSTPEKTMTKHISIMIQHIQQSLTGLTFTIN